MKKYLAFFSLFLLTASLFGFSRNLVVKKDFAKDEIKNLEFHLKSESLKITPIYGEGITLEIYCNNSKKIPLVVQDDDKLTFTSKINKLSNRTDLCVIELFVPTDYKFDEIKFNATSGDFDFSKLNVDSITCSITSGDIVGKNLNADNSIKFNLTSGDLEIETINCENLTAYATSGDIELKNISATTLRAECTSGDIELNSFEGESIVLRSTSGSLKTKNTTADYFDTTTTSGSIKIELKKAPKASSIISSNSGSVELIVPHDQGFNIQCSSVSGSFEDEINDFKMSIRNSFRNSYYGGGAEINIKTTSGSIELDKN